MAIIKHKDQRVGVFIDVPNLYHSAKNIYRAKVNFKEVLKTAVANRKLIRAIAYSIRTESGEEQAFFEALTKIGIEVKMKDLQIFPGGMKKGDWDVGLAVDAIELGEKLDAVVLVTGDGDFLPLVKYLQIKNGCQVEVIAFSRSASSNLREVSDDFIDLGQNLKKYLIS
jgi:uncharacterized protein (TIGR00288 family)